MTPTRTCPRCGVGHRGRQDHCYGCRRYTEVKRSAQNRDDDLELTGGTWVNINGVQRWVPDKEPEPAPIVIEVKAEPQRQEGPQLRDTPQHQPSVPKRGALCVCGCLIFQGEDCPNCLLWARENERRWARVHRYVGSADSQLAQAREKERPQKEAA